MDFIWNGEQRHLQGLTERHIQSSSWKEMSKELWQNNSLFAICVETSSTDLPKGIHPEMQKLLDQFPDVYHRPNQLLPERIISHRINLKEGKKSSKCPAVKVRLLPEGGD